MESIARALFPGPAESFESLEVFWARHLKTSGSFERPIDRAIGGGALADRTGYAFAAGYTAALQALFPGLEANELASLAATEQGGVSPRAIQTTLSRTGRGLRLQGDKTWVTLGGATLFVLARVGDSADPAVATGNDAASSNTAASGTGTRTLSAPSSSERRARLVVVRVPSNREGIQLEPLSELPFVPEISHAALRLRDVAVAEDEVLPGDGWESWVKPFRTVEDLHVHAAVLAFCLATGARLDWPRPLRERLAAILVAVRALAIEAPSSREVHLALAGVIAQSRSVIDELEPHFVAADEPLRSRWARDRPLLEVASKARAARTERAWSR